MVSLACALCPHAGFRNSVRYLGASASALALNAARAVGSSSCGEVVRVATGIPTLQEKLFQSSRGANTQQPRGSLRFGYAAERCLNLAFEHSERFLEIAPMVRRPPARRNIHVDHAVATGRVSSRQKNGVCVSCYADMWMFWR